VEVPASDAARFGDADLYANAPCGLLVTAANGAITVVNDTFLAWTKFDRAELVDRRFADLLSPGGRLYHETHFMPMLQMQGSVREIAFELVGADRSQLPVLVNARAVRSEDDQISAIHVAVFEATERRQYERELLDAKQRAEASEARANILAHTLQANLIPPALPRVDGLDLGAIYRPAGSGDEVGGDFYDVFKVATDDWVVSIGDVCGKGVDAAVVSALVRHTTRAAAVEHPAAAHVLATVNEVLLRHDTDRFCTVALLRLRRDASCWQVTMSLGGHPLPLYKEAGGSPLTELGRPGLLLGAFDHPNLPEDTIRLEPGDAVALYTDGITEGRNGDDFFGEDRLAAAFRSAEGTAQEQAARIAHEVLVFQRNDTRDDIAVVVIRVPERGDDVSRTEDGPTA
jgi:sigma-B regulation protein RsbU (phosphoserine phosphatase)